jgi:chromosome segregation ATPase
MSDELKEFAEIAAQMERQYVVFAKAHKVIAALRQANDKQAALDKMIRGQETDLAALKKQTSRLETRRKKAAGLVAELEATAKQAIDERRGALTAVLEEHIPDIAEAARARTYAMALAEAVFQEAIAAHQERMAAFAGSEEKLAHRIESFKTELRDMVDRATGQVVTPVQ